MDLRRNYSADSIIAATDMNYKLQFDCSKIENALWLTQQPKKIIESYFKATQYETRTDPNG